MRILVIHQVPYRKIDYHRGIDHDRHDVTYIGQPHRMADLPAELRCRRLVLDEGEDLLDGILARTSRADGYEKVLSLSEFAMFEARRVREHLGLPGPDLAQVERVRDKVSMKAALAGSGIRYPRFVAAPPACGPLPWSGRTVVKPRQGASSEGVAVYATAREALSAYRRLDNPREHQLEEYVEGDILHADGLVSDGELVHLVVSRYITKPVDFVTGTPLGSYQLPHDEEHFAFAARVVKALGITEGCLHLEMFETPEGDLVFLEVANRVGGAGVITAHERHSGVHLPTHEIAVRLGLPRPEPSGATGRYHAWLVFPGHHLPPGTTVDVTVPDHLAHHPCVDRLHRLGPTEPLPDHVTYQEWLVPVFVEASHQDSTVLGDFLRECVRAITVKPSAAVVAAPEVGLAASAVALPGAGLSAAAAAPGSVEFSASAVAPGSAELSASATAPAPVGLSAAATAPASMELSASAESPVRVEPSALVEPSASAEPSATAELRNVS
ncbi:ATP-grasp domain-containing protein [Streptomyces sp. NPDC006386]|uniref:ATP-grasp domain-containing protein n=1 Tax=Streptomyces sp. NPDC006386 TaxID=3156762 RepID=UPI0033B11135